MSYNGSGTFVINSAGQPLVPFQRDLSSTFNALTADLATGLSTAITKDGQTTTTALITFAAGISSTLATDATSISTGSLLTSGGLGVTKAAWIGGLINVAGAATLQSTLAVSSTCTVGGDVVVRNANATDVLLTLGGSPTDNWSSRINLLTSTNQINWQISTNTSPAGSGGFALTPSTIAGGSTFTTAALKIDSAGAVTIPGTLGVTGASTFNALAKFDIGNVTGTLGQNSQSNIHLGTAGGAIGNLVQIAMGYQAANTNSPAAIGFVATSAAGNTKGDLIFGTRDVTTDTAPTERMRISSAGAVTIGGTITLGTRLLATPSNFGYSSAYKALFIGSTSTDYTTNAVSICLNYDPSVNPTGTFQGDGSEILVRRDSKITVPNAANTTLTNVLTFLETGLTIPGTLGVTGGAQSAANTTSAPNNTATALVTLPSNGGLFIVHVYLASTGNAPAFHAYAMIATASGTNGTILHQVDGTNMFITMALNVVSGRQTAGSTQNIECTYLRIQQ